MTADTLAMAELHAELSEGMRALQLAAPASAIDQWLAYLALLDKWNHTYNLTAVRDPALMVSNHLLDSLAIAPHLRATQMLDVGTGAGLPGIPLAILWPKTPVTLLDSVQKKTAFLRFAAAQLGLQNVQVVCARVEHWKPATPFDLIVSRAFSELSEFVAAARPLLAPGGVLAAMKGVHPAGELSRLPPDVKVREVIPLQVPGLDARRHLVLMECP